MQLNPARWCLKPGVFDCGDRLSGYLFFMSQSHFYTVTYRFIEGAGR